ncbi:tetratricopeptide repeat protein [Pseudomonas luteola]
MRKYALTALAIAVFITGCSSNKTSNIARPDPAYEQQTALIKQAEEFAKVGEFKEQIKSLQTAEGMGSAQAAYELGKIYSSGSITAMDKQKAFEHFQAAANLGSIEGKITASWLNMYGIGTAVNEKAGLDLMKEAAKTDIRAKREMGLMYGDLRLPFLHDEQKGMKYLSEASGQGDANATYYLSVLATRLGKVDVAHKALVRAAEMGQPKAALELGREAMQAGEYMKARSLFLTSANAYDSEGMFELGKGQAQGKITTTSNVQGVTPTIEAYVWLLGSSGQKHLQAQEELAKVEARLPTDPASKAVIQAVMKEIKNQVEPWQD